MRKMFTVRSSLLQQSVDHCNSEIYFSPITTKNKEEQDARLEGVLFTFCNRVVADKDSQ